MEKNNGNSVSPMKRNFKPTMIELRNQKKEFIYYCAPYFSSGNGQYVFI